MKTTVSGCCEDGKQGLVSRCEDDEADFWSVYTSTDDTPQMWHSDHESRAAAEFEAARIRQ